MIKYDIFSRVNFCLVLMYKEMGAPIDNVETSGRDSGNSEKEKGLDR